MPAKVFVDTNIWLYALVQQPNDIRHQKAADFVLQLERPIINSQVIRETCNNLIRKFHIPEIKLQKFLKDWYQSCEVIPSNEHQHLLASRLRINNAFSYWDSLIVAAALDAECKILLTEDMQHGQMVEAKLTIINPFISSV